MPASMREAQAQDWLDDLREFGPAIVAEACRRWRRQPGSRRPTPGDIRALCVEEQRDYRTGQKALPPPDSISEDDIHKIADAWARERGFDCIEACQRAGHSIKLRLPNGRYRNFEALERPVRRTPGEEGDRHVGSARVPQELAASWRELGYELAEPGEAQ